VAVSRQDSVTNLRTFQMAKNCLIAAGCHQVARIVARSPQLEDLKVSGTRVPSVGTLALVRTLLANGALRLRRLDLSDNSFEAADSYEALAQLLAAPQVPCTHDHISAENARSLPAYPQPLHYLPVTTLSIIYYNRLLFDSL
jgi:hypothetical protein